MTKSPIENTILSLYFEPFRDNATLYTTTELRDKVIYTLHQYLNSSPEALFQAMYKMDVREDLFKQKLWAGDIEGIADMILQRVGEKIAYRKKYSESQTSDPTEHRSDN